MLSTSKDDDGDGASSNGALPTPSPPASAEIPSNTSSDTTASATDKGYVVQSFQDLYDAERCRFRTFDEGIHHKWNIIY
jgi:hypothetical protein